MTITLLLFGLALLFVLFLVRYAPWKHASHRPDGLPQALQPVSVPALLNLIDTKNLEFLQRSLSAADFRRSQRERCRALRIYVRRIAENARILIAAAEVAKRADDPAVAESGRVLLETSLATRTRALRALVWLYITELSPGLLPDLSDAIRTYESAAARMDALQSLTSR